ncbi:MAG: HAMP domain-containing sensor histidine kinase [Myxococcota bacterium]
MKRTSLSHLIGAQIARAGPLTRARDERIQTERLALVGRMLAGVAHDLRNPMTVISGYAQLMVFEEDPVAREVRSERIMTQIDEMTAMITDLLAFSRGHTELTPVTVDLPALAQSIAETLGIQCKPRGIVLRLKAPPIEAHVDPARVKRIVLNLAKNATDVLRRGQTLSIEFNPIRNGVSVRVSDTGPGIPEEVKSRLFEPFVTAGKANGTGLGLSIVRRFVDDHGGNISVESVLGKGTSFYVELPNALPVAVTKDANQEAHP